MVREIHTSNGWIRHWKVAKRFTTPQNVISRGGLFLPEMSAWCGPCSCFGYNTHTANTWSCYSRGRLTLRFQATHIYTQHSHITGRARSRLQTPQRHTPGAPRCPIPRVGEGEVPILISPTVSADSLSLRIASVSTPTHSLLPACGALLGVTQGTLEKTARAKRQP
jgi:hypothetical protein